VHQKLISNNSISIFGDTKSTTSKKDKHVFNDSDFIKHCSLSMIPGIKKLIIFSCDFDRKEFDIELFDLYGVKMPALLEKSVVKRQAEFLAGRYAALSALNYLGIRASDIPIGTHRSPVWPNEVVASITHTNNRAICAVGYSKEVKYIGIDLEGWLKPDTVKEIKSTIVSEEEESLLKQSSMKFDRALTLAFSAKESLFKALYPSVGCYFDFSAAAITGICEKRKSFNIKLMKKLTSKLEIGSMFTGYFSYNESCIQTMIIHQVGSQENSICIVENKVD
jgi:enterobactin synthetase component D